MSHACGNISVMPECSNQTTSERAQLLAAMTHHIYLFINSQPWIMHLTYSDWVTQAWLSARNVFFVMSQHLSDHKVLHQVFFDFTRIFSLFSLVFRTSNFWSLRNLIKQLFHLLLLDMRLVIANSLNIYKSVKLDVRKTVLNT